MMGRIIGALIALAGTGAGVAHAGTYDVNACGASDIALDASNNTWVGSATDAMLLMTGSVCPATSSLGGLFTTDTLSGLVPDGARGEWRFTAPVNTAIGGLRASRALEANTDDDWLAYTRTDTATLESCRSGPGVARCVIGLGLTFPASPTTVTFTGLNAAWAAVGAYCTPNGFGCSTGLSVHHVAAILHQATVTLTDPVAPVPAAPTGALTQPGVWLRGTAPLSASATDAGGGVGVLRLVVDGAPQTGAGRVALACDYTYAVPCPLTGSAPLALNTTTVTDGTHTVAVQAEDAGGATANTASTTPWTIRVDNHAPGSPVNLAVDTPPVTGTPIGVTWTNPSQGTASPIATAKWQLTPLDSGSDGQSGSASATTGHLTGPTAARPGRWTLDVWLVDEAGNENPANATSVIIDTRPPVAPTGVAIVGGAPNAQTGAWQATYTVPTPQVGMAPPASVQWQVCRAGAGCESGSAPSATPGTHLLNGSVIASGTYTLTLAVTDTAGRQSSGSATTFMWTTPAPGPTDTDGDGVADATDLCPTVAGSAANNGCPALPPVDADGDGISDTTDACPTVPGFASTNGCPLVTPPAPNQPVDSDHDGIPDMLDACPSVAASGTANGCAAAPLPTAPPVRSNSLKVTGSARYVAATHRVILPIASASWVRAHQVRVKRGTAIGTARVVRTRSGATRLVVDVPVALRAPTRIEWRTPSTARWFGVRINR
jgi:Thrombospondin type 3 repeat